ncbi:MAG: hypothetical protein MUP82_07755 [Candidatus Marinimicrobia bacterium]|nr:hypothetical protein [Candidatus Neomarinimicrobiota bacterium]
MRLYKPDCGQKWTAMDTIIAQFKHTFKIAPRRTLSSHGRGRQFEPAIAHTP